MAEELDRLKRLQPNHRGSGSGFGLSASGQEATFNAATGFISIGHTSPVPEIDPSSMGNVVALVAGALGLLERRRLKAKLAV